MQSSLTAVLSCALVFSTHPPESVCSTDAFAAPRAAFLGSVGSTSRRAALEALRPHHISGIAHLPFDRTDDPYMFEPEILNRLVYPTPSPLVSLPRSQCRNVNLPSLASAVRPQLRFRLTLGGLAWPRKPWVFGERVSHPFNRYSCPHMSSEGLQSLSR